MCELSGGCKGYQILSADRSRSQGSGPYSAPPCCPLVQVYQSSMAETKAIQESPETATILKHVFR